ITSSNTKASRRSAWASRPSGSTTRRFPMTRPNTGRPTVESKSASCAMSEFDDDLTPAEFKHASHDELDHTHLWVISYSDFMTILMIFFLMLFAHRIWEKKVSWEERRIMQLRAAQ